MVMWWWSWILSCVGVTGLWLAGSGKRLGWAIGLGGQVLWLAYAVATEQYGFLLGVVSYGSVYSRNLWKWSKEGRR